MKKYLLILALFGTALFAEDAPKVDMKKNMQEMEVALAVIQRGFLYNDRSGPLLWGGSSNRTLPRQTACWYRI